MNIDERLRHVKLKVKRAKEHVEDLQRQISLFINTNPYKIAVKPNPQSGKSIFYVVSVEDTPACLPLIAGDATQNLMGALDHLAYQLVCSDTGDAPPNPSRIYFPILDDAAKYEAKKREKIEGASQDTIKAIDNIKPYKGGNDSLWKLYRLNNIEKHRLLITVGSVYRSVNVGAMGSRMLADIFRSDPNHPLHGKEIPLMNAFFKTANVQFPLKAGDIVLESVANPEMHKEEDFRFDIALNEPPIIEAQSILETLHEFTTLVEGIIAALTPRLK